MTGRRSIYPSQRFVTRKGGQRSPRTLRLRDLHGHGEAAAPSAGKQRRATPRGLTGTPAQARRRRAQADVIGGPAALASRSAGSARAACRYAARSAAGNTRGFSANVSSQPSRSPGSGVGRRNSAIERTSSRPAASLSPWSSAVGKYHGLAAAPSRPRARPGTRSGCGGSSRRSRARLHSGDEPAAQAQRARCAHREQARRVPASSAARALLRAPPHRTRRRSRAPGHRRRARRARAPAPPRPGPRSRRRRSPRSRARPGTPSARRHRPRSRIRSPGRGARSSTTGWPSSDTKPRVPRVPLGITSACSRALALRPRCRSHAPYHERSASGRLGRGGLRIALVHGGSCRSPARPRAAALVERVGVVLPQGSVTRGR